MPVHKKHEDSLDVQVRTRILDEYGNEMAGVIEYDPVSGFGKRIKLDARPDSGFVEPFFRKGGSIEIDGHTFDADNHDENKVNAIRTLIDAKVARGTPEYEQLLKQHIDEQRNAEQIRGHEQRGAASAAAAASPDKQDPDRVKVKDQKFIAITQIARGEEVKIDLDSGQVKGTRSDNVHKPQTERGPDHEVITT
jgi:hypothetical protein